MFIMKTRCDDSILEKWRVKLGFQGKIVVNSVGSSGGLCLFWSYEVDVSLLSFSQAYIDVCVRIRFKLAWRFTNFYGSPVQSQKVHFWTLLRRLAGLSSLPWVCVGDFNEIVGDVEKMGGNRKNWKHISDF